jgi:hypothetical protein
LFADIEGEDRTRAYRVVRSIDAVPSKDADANAWRKLASASASSGWKLPARIVGKTAQADIGRASR